MVLPFFAMSGRRPPAIWKAVNDDEKPLSEVLGDLESSYDFYLAAGDALEMADGKLWICTRSGNRKTAYVVEGRYKKPTERFP